MTHSHVTRAAILYATNQPLVLDPALSLPLPGAGQVLVHLLYTGICQSQIMEIAGRRGVDRFLPHLLGHEGTGTVVSIGEGVSKVKPGDDVILTWIKCEGMEGGALQLPHHDHYVNAGPITTFSEYTLVSENRLVKKPDGLSDTVASIMGCAILTGAGMVKNQTNIGPDSTVVIWGLGGIGLSACLMAASLSPKQLIVVEASADKLVAAKAFGATACVNAQTEAPIEAIYALTQGLGADVVIESVGKTTTIEQAFKATKRGGLCLFASHPGHGETISIDPHELICGKQIRGSWGGGSSPDRDIPFFAKRIQEGILSFDALVSKVYPLSRINEALQAFSEPNINRVVLACRE